LDGGYGPPPGFCFDQNQCNGGFPVMDDLCMEDDNVALYVDRFVEAAFAYANNTRAAGAVYMSACECLCANVVCVCVSVACRWCCVYVCV